MLQPADVYGYSLFWEYVFLDGIGKVSRMKSILCQLLFDPVQLPAQRGRQIKFDSDEPDILFTTGPMDERITLLMRHRGYPMSAREIASGIGSNASQVNKGLKTLMANGCVDMVDMQGCVREYVLR